MIEVAARRSDSDGPGGGGSCGGPGVSLSSLFGISERKVAWGAHGSRGHWSFAGPCLSLSDSTRSPALRCRRGPFR
eukprot:509282-Heterocapsa_arctica.AAC.1